MKNRMKKDDEISVYINDKEQTANRYVMHCYAITMLVYTIAFILDMLDIFVVEKRLVIMGYIPSLIIYIAVYAVTRFVSLSNPKLKYFILLGTIFFSTIAGVSITYHVVLVPLLPFLYARRFG